MQSIHKNNKSNTKRLIKPDRWSYIFQKCTSQKDLSQLQWQVILVSISQGSNVMKTQINKDQ